MHSHDVRALITWPPHHPFLDPELTYADAINATVSSFIISGGLDMAVCICPTTPPSSSIDGVRNLIGLGDPGSFDGAYYRRMPFGVTTSAVVQISSASRIILCRNDESIIIYRLNTPSESKQSEDVSFEDGDGWSRVADIRLQPMTNLICSAISNDGEWVAVSDNYETRLFHLGYTACESCIHLVKQGSIWLKTTNALFSVSSHLATQYFLQFLIREL